MVGEEGPELVNFSQPERVYTAALFRSATPRAADTDSGSDAEVKALRRVYKAVTARTGKQPDQHCEGTDAA